MDSFSCCAANKCRGISSSSSSYKYRINNVKIEQKNLNDCVEITKMTHLSLRIFSYFFFTLKFLLNFVKVSFLLLYLLWARKKQEIIKYVSSNTARHSISELELFLQYLIDPLPHKTLAFVSVVLCEEHSLFHESEELREKKTILSFTC